MRRRAGEAVADAARLAARQRFRAILLTSLTTVAGLLPRLTETSLQARVPVPLVTSLVFGLFPATLPVLAMVPVPDVIVDDYGLTRAAEEGDAAPPAPAAG
ncbi:MAG: efflux RND transporter permease subunit [Alphaproteobacteria bacterium]|nr:efflux RND transporter permease subunit [Alphaproteobacteria bacterium]